MVKRTVLALVLVCLPMLVAAQEQKEQTAITVYNQDFGVVKETRFVNMTDKIAVVRFFDVAQYIDPTTVVFRSLTDPSATVLEQNFEFDLVSADKLLKKYIDKNLKVFTKDRKYEGTLLSFDSDQIVLRTPESEVVMIQRYEHVQDIQFGSLPEGLLTRPTLVWMVSTEKPGKQLVEVAYQTGGLTWRADYNVVVNATDTKLGLNGWVTVTNNSGTSYKDAKLKLVAGDVRKLLPAPDEMFGAAFATEDGKGGPQFEEKAFFEYHLYTLPRPTTLAQNQIKQIEFLRTDDVPLEKVYMYDGTAGMGWYGGLYEEPSLQTPSNKKVNVFIEWKNSKENNMGMPLPKGLVRVYKMDEADSSLEFIGENSIDHTPKDEKISLLIGDAFDIVGERKQTDFQSDSDRHWMKESFEIVIRNHKEQEVTVKVKETLYRWNNWKIIENSDQFEKQDAQTIFFNVKVPKDGEKKVTYTAEYTW